MASLDPPSAKIEFYKPDPSALIPRGKGDRLLFGAAFR